ncbi:MAG TPA: hypothetical protein GX499_10365 [Clostridiales bacterium]|nr:hypothetical protein [Clostridiales bacterium]
MTKIVKSVLVVDDRPLEQKPVWAPQPLASGAILKGAAPPPPPRMPTQDEYIDQLNRLRVEIRKAKEELRDLNAQIQEAQARQEELHRTDLQLWNIDTEVAVIIEKAKADAERILNDARAQGVQMAEEARNNGYLEGFSRGYEEATQEFHKQYDPLMVKIADVLDRLSDYEARLLREQEEYLVELAMTVAKKVIGQTLDTTPAAVVELLREAVEKAKGEKSIKVTLSPDLVPLHTRAGEEVRKLLAEAGAEVTLVTDEGLEPGSAFVETPKGMVDVSIHTQLNNLKDAALGR